MTSARAVHTILEFIGRVRPAYARTLRCEIAGMTEDDQLNRVTQALAAIRPTESAGRETVTLVQGQSEGLPPKVFFDELRASTAALIEANEKLRALIEK